MSLVSKPAPLFVEEAVLKGIFTKVDLAAYRGKWVVLFFYPMDFTFVCPTEITSLSDRYNEFTKLGAEVLGVSVDSKFSHNAWMGIPREEGGIGMINYPLIADFTKEITQNYGILLPEGMALRATYIIDPDGIVQLEMVHSNNVGRNVDEIIRFIEALQFTREHGEVCPAGWTPGESTIVPDVKKSKDFFAKK